MVLVLQLFLSVPVKVQLKGDQMLKKILLFCFCSVFFCSTAFANNPYGSTAKIFTKIIELDRPYAKKILTAYLHGKLGWGTVFAVEKKKYEKHISIYDDSGFVEKSIFEGSLDEKALNALGMKHDGSREDIFMFQQFLDTAAKENNYMAVQSLISTDSIKLIEKKKFKQKKNLQKIKKYDIFLSDHYKEILLDVILQDNFFGTKAMFYLGCHKNDPVQRKGIMKVKYQTTNSSDKGYYHAFFILYEEDGFVEEKSFIGTIYDNNQEAEDIYTRKNPLFSDTCPPASHSQPCALEQLEKVRMPVCIDTGST